MSHLHEQFGARSSLPGHPSGGVYLLAPPIAMHFPPPPYAGERAASFLGPAPAPYMRPAPPSQPTFVVPHLLCTGERAAFFLGPVPEDKLPKDAAPGKSSRASSKQACSQAAGHATCCQSMQCLSGIDSSASGEAHTCLPALRRFQLPFAPASAV